MGNRILLWGTLQEPPTRDHLQLFLCYRLGAGGGDIRTNIGTSGTEVLAVAAPAAAVLVVAKPGVGATAAVAGASGATASGIAAPGTGTSAAAALGAIGLAEVAAHELPTSVVASAVAAEAPIAWTPADEPAVVEELPG